MTFTLMSSSASYRRRVSVWNAPIIQETNDQQATITNTTNINLENQVRPPRPTVIDVDDGSVEIT